MPDHFHAIIVHRRITEEERKAEVSYYLELAKSGATLIGGFISPGEKEVAKSVLEIAGAKVICLLPYGLKGYKPHGIAVKRLAESKTLVFLPGCVELCYNTRHEKTCSCSRVPCGRDCRRRGVQGRVCAR